MSAVVFRHGPRPPRAQVVGYGPKPGFPRDEAGALILVFNYARPDSVEVPPASITEGPVIIAPPLKRPRPRLTQDRLL